MLFTISVWFGCKLEVLMTPFPWIWSFARTIHRFRETLTFISLLYNKGYDKGFSEQPDEEIQRARPGKVPSGGALFPWSWGIEYCLFFLSAGALWTLYLWDFYEGFITQAWWITNSNFNPSLLPRRWARGREQGWKFRTSNSGLIFLVQSPSWS